MEKEKNREERYFMTPRYKIPVPDKVCGKEEKGDMKRIVEDDYAKFEKYMNRYLAQNRSSKFSDDGMENIHTRKFDFHDGMLNKTHEVELCEKPIAFTCFTESFVKMVQLFKDITDHMDFSQPFRAVIDYDPERLRTVIRFYETKEFLQQYSERVGGNVQG